KRQMINGLGKNSVPFVTSTDASSGDEAGGIYSWPPRRWGPNSVPGCLPSPLSGRWDLAPTTAPPRPSYSTWPIWLSESTDEAATNGGLPPFLLFRPNDSLDPFGVTAVSL